MVWDQTYILSSYRLRGSLPRTSTLSDQRPLHLFRGIDASLVSNTRTGRIVPAEFIILSDREWLSYPNYPIYLNHPERSIIPGLRGDRVLTPRLFNIGYADGHVGEYRPKNKRRFPLESNGNWTAVAMDMMAEGSW